MAEKMQTMESLMAAGKAIMIGEYRGSKPETINYTNKKGAAASFGRVVHTVECGEGQKIESVKVSQSVPDGTKPEDVNVPYKKGQRLIIEVDAMEMDKGNRSIRTSGLHLVA